MQLWLLQKLQWLPIVFSIQFKIVLLVCKALYRLASQLGCHQNTIPADCLGHKIKISMRQELCLSLHSLFMPLKIWNSLPSYLKFTPTLCSFKSQLKTLELSWGFRQERKRTVKQTVTQRLFLTPCDWWHCSSQWQFVGWHCCWVWGFFRAYGTY